MVNLLRGRSMFFLLCFCVLAFGCNSGGGESGSSSGEKHVSAKAGDPNVIIHELSDPDNLNPITYQSAGTGYVLNKISYSLLQTDFETLEYLPVLAKAQPTIEERTDSDGLLITYEIRPEATWDNGDPIVAEDFAFTLKVLMAPSAAVDNARVRPYFEFIEDLKLYPDDPKKMTFVCKEKYIRAKSSTALGPLPRYVYDPENKMAKFTVKQFADNADKYAKDADLLAFGKNFSSPKYEREKGYVVGCGPYEFDGWVTNKNITLKRKKNWWGDKLAGTNNFFTAVPPTVTHETIKDQTTAITAMKSEKLDVMRGIKPKEFVDLPKSEKFTKNFNRHTPIQYAYTYLGLNTRLPKFSDKRVRKAFAHLVDVQTIIDNVQYGLAEQITSEIHPTKPNYHKGLKPYEFSVDKAKALLEEAGWTDTNGNGIRDKMIDGELVEMKVDYTYNSGNDQRESTGLIFKESARKAGVEVSVIPQEWAVYLQNQKRHQFEMCYGAWVSVPLPNDPKQLWHTESYNGGSNYVGFGNAETDKLIEDIRKELDDEKRKQLSMRLQEIQHDECAYLFMFCPKERVAIHNRFEGAKASPYRPGYNEMAFSLGEGKAASATH